MGGSAHTVASPCLGASGVVACVPGPGHGQRSRLHLRRDAAASDSERYDDFSPSCNNTGSLMGPPHGLEMGGERHRRSGGGEP
jgi:hypothetical protein